MAISPQAAICGGSRISGGSIRRISAKGGRMVWNWHEICFPRWKMGPVDLYHTLCERKRGPGDIVVYPDQVTCPECRARYTPGMALSGGISEAKVGGT